MIRLLEPILATSPLTKDVVAKQKIGIPASNEISVMLKSKRSLIIGISGLIRNNPARMFIAARKIGAPVRNLLFKLDLSKNLAISLFE
jgi:hypothetical protein